jgi:hypothetical protein
LRAALVERAQREGVVRRDTNFMDVVRMVGGIALVPGADPVLREPGLRYGSSALSSGPRIRLLVALVGLAVGVVAVAAVIVHDTRRTPATPARNAVASSAFPAPPVGAVVYARQAGSNLLALGVVPRRGALLLHASVLGGQGHGVSGLRVAFSVRGERRVGTPCGAGCYRATIPLSERPTAVSLAVVGRATSISWRVDLPAVWPPPDGAAILARAGRVWRSLRSLAYVEQLAFNSTGKTTSTWRVAAPDRLAYSVRGSGGGVVIGGRRWDRSTPGGPWLESPQSGAITQPVPFWVGVSNAHVLGTVRASGHAAWLVSFFDPGTPAWFEATVDKRTGHTLVLRMFAAAHFMTDVYRSFDSARPIVPPR